MAVWGLSGAAIQDMMTRRVGDSEQVQLQGALSSSRSIAGLVAPGVFAGLFAWTLAFLPGAAFLLAGAPLVAAAVVARLVTAPPRRSGPPV